MTTVISITFLLIISIIITWIHGYDYGKDYGYRKGWEDCSLDCRKIYREMLEMDEAELQRELKEL